MASSSSKIPQQSDDKKDAAEDEPVETTPSPENKQKLVRNIPGRQSKGKLLHAVPKGDDLFVTETIYPSFELLEQKVFVDKTMFLNIVLRTERPYRCTLPRAMGKTLMLKMVESFCDVEPIPGIPKRPIIEKRENIWKDTEIYIQQREFFEQHFGQHPTIFITLHSVHGSTLESMLNLFRTQLKRCCNKFRYIYDQSKHTYGMDKYLMGFMEKALNGGTDLSKNELIIALTKLAEIVKTFHGNSKTVLLMDEYEKPVTSLFSKDVEKEELKKIIEFHNQLMVKTFKSNPYINFAILAGILKTGPPETSGLRYKDCDLLKGSDLNQFFGFSKNDIEEMANEIKKKCNFEIPQNVIELLWSWCNGYTYSYDDDTFEFCNPYAVCRFLNDYVKSRNKFLPALLVTHLKIHSFVANLKDLFEKDEISEMFMDILSLRTLEEKAQAEIVGRNMRSLQLAGSKKGGSKKLNYRPFLRTANLKENFFLEEYQKFNDAMKSRQFNVDEDIVKTFISYLCQIGILTDSGGVLIVPNQQLRNQINALLVPSFKRMFQFSNECLNNVTVALEDILFVEGLQQLNFKSSMKKLKQAFIKLLEGTKQRQESEFFSHALLTTVASQIKDTLHFIPDVSYTCQDREQQLKIDLSFALNYKKLLTTFIIEMKWSKSATEAVMEAIYYRKVYDEIRANKKITFDRFIYIGINVPKGYNVQALSMCYRVENGNVAQDPFVSSQKMKLHNKTHPPSRLGTIPIECGKHYFQV